MSRAEAAVGAAPPELFFILGAISQYLGAAVAVGLFDELPPGTVALVRVLAAAAIIVLLRRSWRRTWTRSDVAWTAAFGISLAAMNTSIYFAIEQRIVHVDVKDRCTAGHLLARHL